MQGQAVSLTLVWVLEPFSDSIPARQQLCGPNPGLQKIICRLCKVQHIRLCVLVRVCLTGADLHGKHISQHIQSCAAAGRKQPAGVQPDGPTSVPATIPCLPAGTHAADPCNAAHGAPTLHRYIAALPRHGLEAIVHTASMSAELNSSLAMAAMLSVHLPANDSKQIEVPGCCCIYGRVH